MRRVGIIGAGHAGVEAAVAARRGGAASVVLFSDEAVPPCFRPRLPEVAFGQAPLEAILVHPASWYAARGIELRLQAAVREIDPAAPAAVSAAGRERFDALVLATGALPLMPPLEGLTPGMPVLPLWRAADTARIRARVVPGRRMVVIGGGILGIEAALRGREAGLEVIIVERLPRLLPLQLGPAASAVVLDILARRGLDVRLGRVIVAAESRGNGLLLRLDEGGSLTADMALAATGARPNAALAAAAGLRVDRGVIVDETLRTSSPAVFAAGDVAQTGPPARCALRTATLQGRVAGANAAADNDGLRRYNGAEAPVAFKTRELELYSAGTPAPGEGEHEERLDDGTLPHVYRAVIRRGGQIVGVQMVGTREGFDALAGQIPAQPVPQPPGRLQDPSGPFARAKPEEGSPQPERS